MFHFRKKKSVSVGALRDEVFRQRERDWAPALSAQSVADFHDIRVEFDNDERVATLETLLEQARATASNDKMWIEMLQDSLTKKRVQFGEQVCENKRLQEENERLRAELLATKAADKAAKLVKDLDDALCCPISMGLFEDPVVSKVSGHSYSREHIEKWLLKNSCCPVTRQKMAHKHLVPNWALAGVVDAFRAHQARQAKQL